MPGNLIKINNNNELSWYVGDSQMGDLLVYLNKVGFKESRDNDVATDIISRVSSSPCLQNVH